MKGGEAERSEAYPPPCVQEGVRTMIIVMMEITHPHSQASVASAPGGGNQRFPRNEGGRCERQRAYSPPLRSGFRFLLSRMSATRITAMSSITGKM